MVNMTIPKTQMHKILTNVSAKEIAPIVIKSSSLETAPARMSMACAQQIPALTAGGSKEAEIATPTKEEVLLPKMDKATPMPLGIAMAIPVINPPTSPRDDISSVGQSSAYWEKAEANPTTAPVKTAIKSAPTSTAAEARANFQSKTRLPNVIPMTGPIMGDTNMLATITTVELVMRPTPARILAMSKSAKKSKLMAACS
mmetsp:Transcript_37720/g.91636  ORF Transcript_37720/g.91636 Transcript_37720/m.91636 type:complete len:200 (-) Transcript_37720:1289-1888(-)